MSITSHFLERPVLKRTRGFNDSEECKFIEDRFSMQILCCKTNGVVTVCGGISLAPEEEKIAILYRIEQDHHCFNRATILTKDSKKVVRSLKSLAWSPLLQQWILIGQDEKGIPTILRSKTGITWTTHSQISCLRSIQDSVWFHNRWVIGGVGKKHSMAFSFDGVIWSNFGPPGVTSTLCVCRQKLLAGGTYGVFCFFSDSENEESGKKVDVFANESCTSLFHNSEITLAGGSKGTIMFSIDNALNWQKAFTEGKKMITNIMYSKMMKCFVVSGMTGMMSRKGIHWINYKPRKQPTYVDSVNIAYEEEVIELMNALPCKRLCLHPKGWLVQTNKDKDKIILIRMDKKICTVMFESKEGTEIENFGFRGSEFWVQEKEERKERGTHSVGEKIPFMNIVKDTIQISTVKVAVGHGALTCIAISSQSSNQSSWTPIMTPFRKAEAIIEIGNNVIVIGNGGILESSKSDLKNWQLVLKGSFTSICQGGGKVWAGGSCLAERSTDGKWIKKIDQPLSVFCGPLPPSKKYPILIRNHEDVFVLEPHKTTKFIFTKFTTMHLPSSSIINQKFIVSKDGYIYKTSNNRMKRWTKKGSLRDIKNDIILTSYEIIDMKTNRKWSMDGAIKFQVLSDDLLFILFEDKAIFFDLNSGTQKPLSLNNTRVKDAYILGDEIISITTGGDLIRGGKKILRGVTGMQVSDNIICINENGVYLLGCRGKPRLMFQQKGITDCQWTGDRFIVTNNLSVWQSEEGFDWEPVNLPIMSSQKIFIN